MIVVLPFPPSVNHCYRRLPDGRVALTQAARDYKERVHQEWLTLPVEPVSGAVAIAMVAWRPRMIGDLDNLLKISLDSLQSHYLVNDAQIVRLSIEMATDPESPRLTCTITRPDGSSIAPEYLSRASRPVSKKWGNISALIAKTRHNNGLRRVST